MLTDGEPSVLQPVMLTAAALLDLVAAFFMVSSGAGIGVLSVFLAAETVLIALAIASWVHYFKKYVHFEIEQSLAGSPSNRS